MKHGRAWSELDEVWGRARLLPDSEGNRQVSVFRRVLKVVH